MLNLIVRQVATCFHHLMIVIHRLVHDLIEHVIVLRGHSQTSRVTRAMIVVALTLVAPGQGSDCILTINSLARFNNHRLRDTLTRIWTSSMREQYLINLKECLLVVDKKL